MATPEPMPELFTVSGEFGNQLLKIGWEMPSIIQATRDVNDTAPDFPHQGLIAFAMSCRKGKASPDELRRLAEFAPMIDDPFYRLSVAMAVFWKALVECMPKLKD